MLYHTDGGTVNDRGDYQFMGDRRLLVVSLGGGVLRFRWNSARSAGVPPGHGAITAFSESSRGRMRRFLRSCVARYTNMVTLTYPCGFPSDGKTVKGHLRSFVERCRRYLGDDAPKEGLFWFLEFQSRGAPHFHIFTTFNVPRETVARWWYEIVQSDDDRHLRAGTRIERLSAGRDGAVAYANKYAAKSEQKEVPPEYVNVGRFWGACFNRECVSAATRVAVAKDGPIEVNRCLNRIKAALKRQIEDGLAARHAVNGRHTVFFLRSIDAQREMQRLITLLAAAYVATDGAWILAVPMPDCMAMPRLEVAA